ncbi:MAG TPA: hypothetical protein VFB75_05315 [Burkholderiales bacterium]|nr:hypothetical protein [Burkholderiales bacterium]
MTMVVRIGAAIVLGLCLAGCATRSVIVPSAVVTSPRTKVIAPQRVKDAVVVGQSTKADVIAALGETLVVSFETGFEVWVYRFGDDSSRKRGLPSRATRSASEKAGPGDTAEFVILFAPSGVVAKTRIRPAPEGRHDG